MTELVSKAILSGLGFMNLSREAIQQSVKHLVNQSKLSEEEGRRLVKDFERRSVQAQQKLEKRVHAAVHKAMKHMNLKGIDAGLKTKKPKRKKSGHTSRSPSAGKREK